MAVKITKNLALLLFSIISFHFVCYFQPVEAHFDHNNHHAGLYIDIAAQSYSCCETDVQICHDVKEINNSIKYNFEIPSTDADFENFEIKIVDTYSSSKRSDHSIYFSNKDTRKIKKVELLF